MELPLGLLLGYLQPLELDKDMGDEGILEIVVPDEPSATSLREN